MKKRTRLYFKSVSEIVGSDGIGVITLTDVGEQRAITLVCDPAMKYQIGLRNSDLKVRGKLLPEVLVTMLSGLSNINDFEMNIYALVEGEYQVTLFNANTLQMSKIRLSDAVLLTRICPIIPLYIDNTLFERQGATYNGITNRMAIPINTLPIDKLKEELQKAIDTEDYRLASVLKDEINKRQNMGNDLNNNEQ